MQPKTVYLLYAPENEAAAKQVLTETLGRGLWWSENPSVEQLEEVVRSQPEALVVALVSDNFLKHAGCLQRFLVLMQENTTQLLPVILDGQRLKEGIVGGIEYYPTQISTIHDTIAYRDFWYDEWIRLRKQSNLVEGEELAALEVEKAFAKKMQPMMSTILRVLNHQKQYSMLDFRADGYAVLYERLQMSVPTLPNWVQNHPEQPEIVAEVEPEIPVSEPEVQLAAPVEWMPEMVAENTAETAQESGFEPLSDLAAPLVESLPEPPEIATETVDLSAVPFSDALEIESEPIDAPELGRELTEYTVEDVEKFIAESENPESAPVSEPETEAPAELEAEIPTESDLSNLENQPLESMETENPLENTPELPEQPAESVEIPATDEPHPLPGLDLLALPDNFEGQLEFENYHIQEVTDLDTLFHLAESETEDGDFDNAKRCYERILELDAFSGRALIWLARLLVRFFPDKLHEAESLYKKAILCTDDNAGLFYEYGLLLQRNAPRRAVEFFKDAIELSPDFEQAYLALAEAQLVVGQADLAKASYLQACLLEPAYQTAENDQKFAIVRRPAPFLELEEAALAEQSPAELVAAEAEPQPTEPAPVAEEPKTVLVTGASSGIGQAVAELFAIQGYKVIITGRRQERLEQLQTSLQEKFQAKVHCLAFDVRDAAAAQAALESLPEEFRAVHILVNNAGLAKGLEPIHEGKLEHWETMIDTNLKGILYVTRLVAPHMVAAGGGHIINIGSAAAKVMYPNGNVYCATKAAVDALTHAMRLDLYQHGVRVSVVHPGQVEQTEFALVRYEDEEKAQIYNDFQPLTAYDVAETIYYLATRPAHVNIEEVLLYATQQASPNHIHRSGR